MTVVDDAARRTAEAAEAVIPDSSRGERRTSFDLADFPEPNGREEDWRFTPVDRLTELFAAEPGEDGAVLVRTEAPEGVEVLDLPLTDERVGSAFRPADRGAVAAWNGTGSALYVGVPKERELEQPVIVRLTGQDGKRGNAHTVVDVGRHSRATVVLAHSGSAQHSGNVEVLVGDGAEVTFVTVQEWDDDARHLGQNDVTVGRDAKVKHIAVTLGGEIVRLNTNVRYAGPGGEATALGVYFADAGQHQEHRLFIDHEPPQCVSRVEYKGALQGDTAHTVWVGDVLIRAGAEGTDTYELNRNLVLTDGARADSVPNLEIETGEIVGAGHASATGRFDDEQLFYLQARGIPEDIARRLVVRGFFADIVHRIGVPEVQDRLMEAIDAELSVSMGAPQTAVVPA
ncbi:MAG TPA: Fe-S cluster assembly protein SufD [Segeticoccus sp.]|nr:Fe-S cluster assembly protein SufD [Segeticoccus sp.]